MPRPRTIKLLPRWRKALNAHGGTWDEFAAQVFGRSRTTIWRYATGKTLTPKPVQTRLETYLTSTTE